MYQKTSLSVVIYRFFPLIATAGMAGFHHLNFDLLLATWPLVISELKYIKTVFPGYGPQALVSPSNRANGV